MEFSDREKVIVLVSSFLSNKVAAQVPKETLALGLTMMLKTKDIDMSIHTLQDMMDAIQQEQEDSLKEGFAFLHKTKDGGLSQ